MMLIINTKECAQFMVNHQGSTAKDLGIWLLNNSDVEPLNVFEQALDWGVGIAAMRMITAAVERRRHFRISTTIDKDGNVVSAKSGRKI
jgi:hypothetical protein